MQVNLHHPAPHFWPFSNPTKNSCRNVAHICSKLHLVPIWWPLGTSFHSRSIAITASVRECGYYYYLDRRATFLLCAGSEVQEIGIPNRRDGAFLSSRHAFGSHLKFRRERKGGNKGLRFARNNLSTEEEECNSDSGETVSTKLNEKANWPVLKRWDVPWDGKTVVVTMIGFGASFLLTGLALSILAAQFGYGRRQFWDLDDQAVFILINQLLQTIVGIGVVDFCISRYKPLQNDLFNYGWENPFDFNRGWLIWGGVGVAGGAAAVLLAGTLVTAVNGQRLPREEQDALLQLLPLIGASRTSTALLVVVSGILAPYLEETVFRGFLMASLTKWVSTPVAVLLSASAFAIAHFTPGEMPQLFALGIVLGFAYAQTHNLLTPIMIHAFWNSGVVLVLAFLRLQGYDIRELI
eukprot:c19484_g1_i1 orf=521-1747(-)